MAAAFCPPEFTIAQLRRVYEIVWDTSLDPRNFHRKVTGTPGSSIPQARKPQATGADRLRCTGRGLPGSFTRRCCAPERPDRDQSMPGCPLSLPMARATGMLTPVIDPDSAVPPYEQVAKMLRDEIAQGTMTGRIPSVHTIAEHHQVSHRVAARALEILQGEGMIENVPGEGHVVRHPRT